MLTSEQVWNTVNSIVEGQGLKLFDLEVPKSSGGTLRVFIWRGEQKININLDDCASVSRAIREMDEEANMFPSGWELEVSSPGVKRRLSRYEHFNTALGERLKVTVGEEGKPGFKTHFGKLLTASPEVLELEDEACGAIIIPFSQVRKARIDFLF